MNHADIVPKFRSWLARVHLDWHADGFLVLRWRDIEAAADYIEQLEAAIDAHRDEVKRLHYWLRCVDADTVSIRDDVATALKPQFIELPS